MTDDRKGTAIPTERPIVDAAPEWMSTGVPVCSLDACPEYDGKRCGVVGQRPSYICEPAVMAMAAVVNAACDAAGDPERGTNATRYPALSQAFKELADEYDAADIRARLATLPLVVRS